MTHPQRPIVLTAPFNPNLPAPWSLNLTAGRP